MAWGLGASERLDRADGVWQGRALTRLLFAPLQAFLPGLDMYSPRPCILTLPTFHPCLTRWLQDAIHSEEGLRPGASDGSIVSCQRGALPGSSGSYDLGALSHSGVRAVLPGFETTPAWSAVKCPCGLGQVTSLSECKRKSWERGRIPGPAPLESQMRSCEQNARQRAWCVLPSGSQFFAVPLRASHTCSVVCGKVMLVLLGPWILPLSLLGTQLPPPAASVVLSPSVWAPTMCMALCGVLGTQ